MILISTLVACSQEEKDKSDDDKSVVNTESSVKSTVSVEQPKELTQKEKDESDYDISYPFIIKLDEYYDYYMKIREKKRGSSSTDELYYLKLSMFTVEAIEKLSKESVISPLYDKEYELKINEFHEVLLEAHEAIKKAVYSAHLVSKGEVTMEERGDLHDEYVIKDEELRIARKEMVKYYNEKFNKAD